VAGTTRTLGGTQEAFDFNIFGHDERKAIA
jgi:hypothetical protein